MSNETIVMFRGNTNLVQVHTTYTDVNGATSDLDVAGSTSTLTITGIGGTAAILQLDGAVVSGNVQFSFLPADTVDLAPQTYDYKAVITTATSDVYTVAKGLFKLL